VAATIYVAMIHHGCSSSSSPQTACWLTFVNTRYSEAPPTPRKDYTFSSLQRGKLPVYSAALEREVKETKLPL